MKLKNKVAIVTGASSGIGKAIAKLFVLEGAIVCVCSIDKEGVDKTVAELTDYGQVIGYHIDITNREDCWSLSNYVIDRYGKIDILINNAGIIRDAQFYKMNDANWDIVIQTNLNGTYNMIKSVLDSMINNKYGKIVNISSVSAFNGNFGQSNYAASKAALIGLTRVMGKELGKYNINVNAIAPGLINTDMFNSIPETIISEKIRKTPLKRLGEPEDVAKLALFLSCEDSSYITSQTIVIDGGYN